MKFRFKGKEVKENEYSTSVIVAQAISTSPTGPNRDCISFPSHSYKPFQLLFSFPAESSSTMIRINLAKTVNSPDLEKEPRFHGDANRATNMSAESLKKLGLFFDDSQRIRVWEPDAVQRTVDLRDESKDFIDKLTEFHNISNEFINAIQDMAKQVEKEKIKALGSSNVLQSMTKQRESQQQQYQSLILEKTAELERLRVQHQSLLKVQSEQQDLIHHIQLR